VGTAWKLILLNGHSPLEGSNITIAFAKGEISGHAGHRDYVGTYIASGDDMRVTSIGMRGVTREPDSRSLWLQEGGYTTHLSMATDYLLSDGRLEIFTAPGDVLVYEPLSDDADTIHKGITWKLTEIIARDNVSSPIPGTEITICFENGEIRGTAGCNQYFGSYTIANGILIEDLSATEMACLEPDGIMQQETQYLNTLRDVMSYTVLENQLTLITGDGRALAYQTEPDIIRTSEATTPAEKSTPGFEMLWTVFSVVVLFLSKRRLA
jgi:heat shock protein HslJ